MNKDAGKGRKISYRSNRWCELGKVNALRNSSPDTVINLHSPQTELETVIMSMASRSSRASLTRVLTSEGTDIASWKVSASYGRDERECEGQCVVFRQVEK